MERRTALKNLGLSFGMLTLTPSVMSMLQSCQSAGPDWTPSFFSSDSVKVIEQLTELIIPSTPDIPGAKDLQLVRFIDSYLTAVADENEKTTILMALQLFTDHCLSITGKASIDALTAEDFDKQLTYFLRASEEEKTQRGTDFSNYRKALESGQEQSAPVEGSCHILLHNLRYLSVKAFKGHAIIAKEHMVYQPVPGQFLGCVDLQEATQGKVWAL